MKSKWQYSSREDKYKNSQEEDVDSDGSKLKNEYNPDEHQGGVESFGNYQIRKEKRDGKILRLMKIK